LRFWNEPVTAKKLEEDKFNMHDKIREVFQSVKIKKSASLSFEAEGNKYYRVFHEKERLIILGAGHIAQPLCTYASDLGFSVTVVDDRPDFANHSRFPEADNIICDEFISAIRKIGISGNDYVAVVTRGHRYDADCIREILNGERPFYTGMIGSKRRVFALWDLLEDEGYQRSELEKIHSPIGLDINALTIKEIAISIVAELISCRRSSTDRRSKETRLVSDDIDLKLLEFLAEDSTPKVIIIVYETEGSTPVKSGAMMALDKNNRSVGSIGGGCGEGAVLRDAYRMIGTGGEKCVTVDLSNDVAGDEGMVCGGRIKVLIKDIGKA